MRATVPTTLPPRVLAVGLHRLSRDGWLRFGALAAIVVLAAVLRLVDLSAVGYANHYYTAAVDSMLQSWHNFFFAAAEPGGSVSVDKPPVGLWVETISAYFFGVNGFAVVLPEILAGVLSVVVVYYLVQRSFGALAGLVAALALAIAPVFVATNRNNTIDSILILTLLLAAWAFLKATETGRLRHLLLGAVIVGIAFNIKMLEAYLPLPAFYLLYLLGSAESLRRKLPKLALATVLILVISLSWATIVDLTPASQRPYVGSSGDNSELSLIVGYNGLERLLGMGPGRNASLSSVLSRLSAGLFGVSNRFGNVPSAGFSPPGAGSVGGRTGIPAGRGFVPGRPGGFGGFPGAGFRGQGGPGFPTAGPASPLSSFLSGVNGLFGNGGNRFGGFGFGGTGRAGLLRLFSVPLSDEVSWLLPFALVSAVILAFRSRLRWPLASKHQALVLWGGWLVTEVIFFSVAGFFHEYYLSVVAPPLAVLVGIGVGELWRLRALHAWFAGLPLLAAAGITLWFELRTAAVFVHPVPWQPIAIVLFVLGTALLLTPSPDEPNRLNRRAATGFAGVVAAMLLTPGIWSALTALNPAANQSLPAAYTGRASRPIDNGQLQVDGGLLAFLESHTRDTKYLMAVPSSMQGSDYVLATGRPILYLGGFDGQDQVETPSQLAELVSSGQLRYIYWNGNTRGGFGFRGFGSFGGQSGQSAITSWVTGHCQTVSGFNTTTVNAGAPGGTTRQNGGGSNNRSGFQISLYDCGTAA